MPCDMSRHRRYETRGFASLARHPLVTATVCGVAFLALAGCAEDPPTPVDRSTTAQTEPSITTSDTLLIEGRPEVLPVASFRSGPDFPLPFRTLVPDTARLVPTIEMAGAEDSGRGFAAAARFEWQPGSDPAFLRLVVLDTTMTDNDARGLVRGIATDFGVIASAGIEAQEAVPPPAHPWATLGYRLSGAVRGVPVDGWISLGRQGERIFYFMALYPPEYGDGLGPRFDYVLRQWEWLDGAARLYP